MTPEICRDCGAHKCPETCPSWVAVQRAEIQRADEEAEHRDPCCPTEQYAASVLCGCRGSGRKVADTASA